MGKGKVGTNKGVLLGMYLTLGRTVPYQSHLVVFASLSVKV